MNDETAMVAASPSAASPLAVRPRTAVQPHDTLGPMSLLHSVRRRWPHMIIAGVICGAIFAAASYALFREKYRSYATLRIHSESPRLAFQVDEAEQAAQFDVYKRTQRELVLGDEVLLAALSNEALAGSAMIKEVANYGDPVIWLRKQLRVDFPGDAEIMLIAMEGDNSRTITLAVNAVLDAYVENVIYAGKQNRSDRLAELRRVLGVQEEKARRLRSKLDDLTKILGSGDADALSVRQQVAIQRFAQLQTEHTRVQFERLSAELRLARLADKLHAKPQDSSSTGTETAAGPDGAAADKAHATQVVPVQVVVPPAEIAMLIQKDSAVAAQRDVVAKALLDLESAQQRVVESNSQFVAALRDRLEREKLALSKLEDVAREGLLRKSAQDAALSQQNEYAALMKRHDELQGELQTLVVHENLLAERLAAATAEADKIGTSSVNVELTKKELERLESINDRIGTEIETLTIELSSGTRVEALGRAREPQGTNNEARIKKAATFGVFGFLLPCVGLFWLDLQRKLVNGAAELNDFSRLRSLGSLPILPRARLSRQRRERGTIALREAVDGIRTVLIREADLSDYRVIQITSAVGGEAKTTFASQLARSLSRAHRRTVLVDLDLRRPSVHEVFGKELAAGVCELLRGEARIDEVLRPSDQDGLLLLFAGQCDRSALAALTKDDVDEILARLREQFEFIVIDTSPVLPVVDALLIAQRADAIILTAMRDVSRAPQLREARDRLWQVGANVIGSVVTTKENRSYYESLDRYVVV